MKNKSALNSTVIKLGLVSLFADLSTEMLYPVTPIFLTSVLGASMLSVGIIEGFAEALVSILKTYAGRLSDRLQVRKPFVWIGYLFAALAKPLTGLSQSWIHVFFARSLDRFGKGIRGAPRDALLAENVPAEQRGSAFGWHRGLDSLGAVFGPLLALLLLWAFEENLRTIYFIALIPGLIAVALVFSVPEKEKAKKIETTKSAQRFQLPGEFTKYLFGWGIFSLTNSSDVFILLKIKQSGASLETTILLYCLYNLIYALGSPYLGGLSDKLGRKKILVLGLLVFVLSYVGFGFAEQTWQFAVLFAIYGIYTAATDGVGKALAVDLIPPEFKATGIGLLGTVTGLTTIVASSMAGFLWDKFNPAMAFFYGAAGALLAIPVLLSIQEKAGEKEKRPG